MSQNQWTIKHRSLKPWTTLTIAESRNLLLLCKILAGADTDIGHNPKQEYWIPINKPPKQNFWVVSDDLLMMRHLCAPLLVFRIFTNQGPDDVTYQILPRRVVRKAAADTWA